LQGATIPLAALTACFALFYDLGLPNPWQKLPDRPTPLLINGASCAVGAFAIQLATTAGIHPLVVVGSPNSSFITDRLVAEDGDAIVDYWAHRNPKALVKLIKLAFSDAGVSSGRPAHALDCVSLSGTFDRVVANAMVGDQENGRKPKMAVLLPGNDYSSADPSVEVIETYTGVAHQGGEVGKRFAYTACRMFALGLSDGWLTPHPYEVREGLESLEQALNESRQGKVRAKKLVIRISPSAE
jgi:NADPH2:quinone reductase